MSEQPQIVILGGGPAGVGAAYRLTQRRPGLRVVVVEARDRPGGNAGSFELDGFRVDYGSHRLHPACDPEILADLKGLLGESLLDRPRHGRIRLEGRWIGFPLKPLDLALRLPPAFALGAAIDALPMPRGSSNGQENFATVLERGLGPTICGKFYFPYARKIWGADPSELSAIQARRRVSAGSPLKLLRKLANAVPGLKKRGAGRFYYPRQGFGAISDRLAEAAGQGGAEILYGTRVVALERSGRHVRTIVCQDAEGKEIRFRPAQTWSTVPLTLAARGMDPDPPKAVLAAASAMEFRAMILIYLTLGRDQFSEWDAHYFPEQKVRITRLSEPKNYAALTEPEGKTVLCAELPVSVDDPEWTMTDEELGRRTAEDLRAAGLPDPEPILGVATRRLKQAYPIYKTGYEEHFEQVDRWLDGLDGFLSFGRQGLFAHDNTHHALAMAYAAVDCLGEDASFDRGRWSDYRREFEKHVVED